MNMLLKREEGMDSRERGNDIWRYGNLADLFLERFSPWLSVRFVVEQVFLDSRLRGNGNRRENNSDNCK